MSRALRAGLLLSRTPIVTAEPSSFEKAYFKYQDELERRLMWTFPWYYYFKRGTLAQRRFNDQQRGPVPRHKGVFYPRGIPDVKHNRERRFKQEVRLPPAGEGDSETIQTQSRLTKADRENDVRSLARKLDSTLYLLVNEEDKWKFPAFDVPARAKSLHEAAENGLRELGGEGINTWTVSNTPAAVIKGDGLPEFLIKSHILHGQFAPANTDFAWLTPSEISDRVDPNYFEKVKALL